LYYLEKVHIAEQAQKFPGQLSGGRQQRVAIARSLCMKPITAISGRPNTGKATLLNRIRLGKEI